MKKLFLLIVTLTFLPSIVWAQPTRDSVIGGFVEDLTTPGPLQIQEGSLNDNPFEPPTSNTGNPFSQQLQQGTDDFGLGPQYQPAEGTYVHPLVFIMRWIQVGLTFLGIGTIITMLYAGFTWMTSAGNPDRVERAKKTLTNSVIGLVIILSSYSLVWFIGRRIQYESAAFGNRGVQFGGEFNQFAE